MQRQITSTLTAVALAGLVVFAQEPAPAQSEKQQAPKETLTGCVVEAKTTDGATAYVLNDAEGGSATIYVLFGPVPSERRPTSTRRWKWRGRCSSQVPRRRKAEPRQIRTCCVRRSCMSNP